MIRIGIIGLGWWGKQIVSCLAKRILAACAKAGSGRQIDRAIPARGSKLRRH